MHCKSLTRSMEKQFSIRRQARGKAHNQLTLYQSLTKHSVQSESYRQREIPQMKANERAGRRRSTTQYCMRTSVASKLATFIVIPQTFSNSSARALYKVIKAKGQEKCFSNLRVCSPQCCYCSVICGPAHLMRNDNKEGNDTQLVLIKHFLNCHAPNK